MTQDDYGKILEHNVGKLTTAVGARTNWRVVPGVLPFTDRGEYFSSWGEDPIASDADRDEFESVPVKFIYVYLTGFETVPDTPVHSPQTEYIFRIFVFQEFTFERADEENVDATSMARRMLKDHNEFVGVLLDIQSEYQGELPMGLTLSEEFVKQYTQPVSMESPATTIEECEFVPLVEGFNASLEERVMMQMQRC